MANEARITVRIPVELDQQIDELAKRLNLSKPEVIRTALTSGVAEGKLAAGLLTNPIVKRLLRTLLALDADPEQFKLFHDVLGVSPEQADTITRGLDAP